MGNNITAEVWAMLMVVKVQFLMFLPKGHKAPGIVTFKDWQKFDVPAGTSRVIKLSLRDPVTGISGVWDLNPKIAATSTIRLSGIPSQWDLFCEALYGAGIKYSIRGIEGLFEGGHFRATDGTQVESGYMVKKLIFHEQLEIDLEDGIEDKELFGEKFKFLKGLNQKTKDIQHIGLNSVCRISERNEATTNVRRSRRPAGEQQKPVTNEDTL